MSRKTIRRLALIPTALLAVLAVVGLARAQLSDAVVAGKQGFNTQSFPYRFNGTNWDRLYANRDTAALVSLAAQGAGTVNSADQVNYNARGVNCVFNQSAHTGSPSSTFAIQVKDAASGGYVTVVTSGAITADATPTMLTMSAGTPNVANVSDGRPLSRTWRVTTTVAGTSPVVTATIGCSLVD